MLIFICDDEEFYLNQVHSLLKEYFCENELNDVSYKLFNSGKELLDCGIVPDIAFLDVELDNNLSGTKIGKYLKEKNPYVKIFIVTAHVGYIDEAFRFSFFRFLTKPVNKSILFENLDDAMYQKNISNKEYVIESNFKIHTIYSSEIIMIEAYKKGSKLYTTNGDLETTYPLAYYDEILDWSYFFKTHRKHIVGLKFVKSFDKENVWLKNKPQPAYLSLAQYKQFKNKFLWYKERML